MTKDELFKKIDDTAGFQKKTKGDALNSVLKETYNALEIGDDSITSNKIAATGVDEGEYSKVVVNAKGQVVAGNNLSDADIPALPISKISGLDGELADKASKDELANVVAGLTPMGSVETLAELDTKPKRDNDAYFVNDQLSAQGDAYIYRYDLDLDQWINTKQVVFKDVARKADVTELAETTDTQIAQLAVETNEVTFVLNLDNFTIEGYSDRPTARTAVPESLRKNGMIIYYTLSGKKISEKCRLLDNENWTDDINWTEFSELENIESEYLLAMLDDDDNVVFAIDSEGDVFYKNKDKYIGEDESQNLLEFVDSEENVIARIDKEGVLHAKSKYIGEGEHDDLLILLDDEEQVILKIDRYGRLVTPGGGAQSSDTSMIVNNLKNQVELLTPAIKRVENYGTQQAKYAIDANFQGRISVKGRLKNDVNTDVLVVPFATFGTAQLAVKHALPVQGMDSYTGAPGNTPSARTLSGFTCNGSTHVYDRFQTSATSKQGSRQPLHGDKVMMFWFKGLDVVNKMNEMSGYETPDEYHLPTDQTGITVNIIPDGNGVATIDVLDQRRMYFIANKVNKIIIKDVRRVAGNETQLVWTSSRMAWIVCNWGNVAPEIDYGASGITTSIDSDTPLSNGYSSMTITGYSNLIKNTEKRAFDNYLPWEYLKSRSELLENYQDLYIEINQNDFIIGRDSTGVIFSTPLKEGGNWKPLNKFYEEMVPRTAGDNSPNEALPHATIPALSDFYITFMNMSGKKTTESLMKCGKIYLVGKYQQVLELNPCFSGNAPYDQPLKECYDCYPYFLYDKINTDEHVFDLILTNSKLAVYINGDKLTEVDKPAEIVIGDNDSELQLYDLEITKGSYGDAEIMSDDYYLVSSRTPFLLGIINHNPYDTYEGSGHPLGNGGVSISRMYDFCQELIDKGYTTIDLREYHDWITGRISIAKKSALIISDDYQLPAFFRDSFRIRGSYDRRGIKINHAQVLDRAGKTSNNEASSPRELVINARLAGMGVGCHTRWHNEPMWKKPSVTVFLEHAEARYILQEHGMNENIFVHNKAGGQFVPQQDLLDYFGYIGVGLSGATDKYTRRTTNRFTISRVQMPDGYDDINAL